MDNKFFNYVDVVLRYNSFNEYFDHMFENTGIDSLKLKDLFDKQVEDNIEKEVVGEEWTDNAEEFRDEGYCRSDILYEDWTEALLLNREEFIEAIAHDLIKKYLEGNEQFLSDLVSYIEVKLASSM